MIKKIKSITKTVEHFLRNDARTRDNDRLLVLRVWAHQNPFLRGELKFFDFSQDFIKGEYADFESIRRSRQKLQEKHPELRGPGHEVKKELAEEVRTQINQ